MSECNDPLVSCRGGPSRTGICIKRLSFKCQSSARAASHLCIASRCAHCESMQRITPMLWFDNQAEEAANFYVSVFKNSKVKQITHYAGEEFPEKKGQVMTVSFELNGQEFTALNPESFRGSSSSPKPCRS